MKNYKYIIFANNIENFLAASAQDPHIREATIREDLYFEARGLAFEQDDKVLITSQPIDNQLLEYWKYQLGYQNIQNWSPKTCSESLCESVLQDESLLEHIQAVIARNPHIIITSYAFTPAFEALIEYFRQLGWVFQTDNLPQNSSYFEKPHQLVTYLDSKAGFRTVVQRLEKAYSIPLIPKGNVFTEIAAAKREIEQFLQQKKPFVVKANYGAAGWGLFLSDAPPTAQYCATIFDDLDKERFWRTSAVIVEEQISTASPFSLAPNSPSAELHITDTEVKITYLCNQVLDRNAAFIGISLGKNVMEPNLELKIRQNALMIGGAFQKMGYRGIFDIDFVIEDNQLPFAVEANMRRTGGTHVYDLMNHLFEENWQQHYYTISRDNFKIASHWKDFKAILQCLHPFLYQKGNTGIIIFNYSKTKNELGYMLVGSSQEEIRAYSAALKLLA